MAGITSTVGFNAILAGSAKTVSLPSLFLSSVESKPFGLRICQVDLRFATFRRSLSVAARYGGGGGAGFRSFGDSRRGRKSDSDDDAALDISTIRSATVRLIDEQQNMVGIVPKAEAIQKAEDAELDLVILSPDADPPVVRIMNYSKYRYEQQKRKKEQQKKTSRVDLKELKMGYNIDQHDYSVRLKAAQKFLQDGDKVKVIVNMKGRENEFRNIAIELIRRFQNDIGELATEESKSFKDRNLFIVLVPNKEVIRKAQDLPSKKKTKPAMNEVSAGV